MSQPPAGNPFGDGEHGAYGGYPAQQQQPQQQQQQQQQRGAPPPPPGGNGWRDNYGSDQIRANVSASIMKEQSIVVPTMSDSMLQEFNKRNIERMQRMKAAGAASEAPAPAPAPAQSANPFDQIETTSPSATSGTLEAMPRYAAPQEPPQQQHYQQQQQQFVRNRAEEDPQLLGITVGFLRRRHDESAHTGAEPARVDDLEAHIRAMTGFGWPTYWQPVHGSMMDFIMAHGDCLALIDNNFVVLREYEAEARARFGNAWSTMPLNMMQQQQQPMGDPYGSYGAPPPQQQQQQQYQGYYEQQQQQQQPSSTSYGYEANPNPYGSAPSYDSHQQQQSYPNMYHQQSSDFGAPPQQVSSGLDDGWVLFDNDSDLNAPIANPFGAPAFADDFAWSGNTYGKEADDPLAIFNGGSAPSDAAAAEAARREEEERRLRKAKKKEDRRKKKQQESEDEKLARRLQEEEDARAAAAASSQGQARASGSAVASGRISGGPVGSNRVALTHVEVRELAEEEIGKDNIRILAGFSVTKFGREGRPHQRKMWINSALTHLAWESSQYDGSHRGLELKQVVGIRIGEMTPTIRRSTKDSRKVRSLCFSLETQARTLDLQACSVIQRDALAAALKKAIEFNQRHKPRRVDKYRTELFL